MVDPQDHRSILADGGESGSVNGVGKPYVERDRPGGKGLAVKRSHASVEASDGTMHIIPPCVKSAAFKGGAGCKQIVDSDVGHGVLLSEAWLLGDCVGVAPTVFSRFGSLLANCTPCQPGKCFLLSHPYTHIVIYWLSIVKHFLEIFQKTFQAGRSP